MYQQNYKELKSKQVPVYHIPPESEIWSEVYSAHERKERFEYWITLFFIAVIVIIFGGLMLAVIWGR